MLMRKVITFVVLLIGLTVFVKPALAEDEQICTTVYGGGVVCGAATEHEPVDTALNIHPAVLGTGLVGLSRVFSFLSKKLKEDTSDILV